MAYKEINPDVWKPEKDGDFVEGVLIAVEKDVGENKSFLYTIEQSPSNYINIWGSTILDPRMRLALIGDKIRITFKGLGEKKGGKQAPKIFKVEVDRE